MFDSNDCYIDYIDNIRNKIRLTPRFKIENEELYPPVSISNMSVKNVKYEETVYNNNDTLENINKSIIEGNIENNNINTIEKI